MAGVGLRPSVSSGGRQLYVGRNSPACIGIAPRLREFSVQEPPENRGRRV
jgi:hypothetical protein